VLTLALDTTTRAGSVAVLRDARVLAVVQGDAARTHGERLPAEIDRVVRDAGVALRDLQLLAVASGPGAFTGLRIGLAAIQGMAMVLNLPVVAVSALDALALAAFSLNTSVPLRGGQTPAEGTDPLGEGQTPGAGSDPALEARPLGARDVGQAAPFSVAAWMDAARGEVFAAYYEWTSAPSAASIPTPTSVPLVGTPDAVLDAIPMMPGTTFIGDGATKYRAQIQQWGGATHPVIAAPDALAPFVARIGNVLAARGEAGPPHALQPLYVRRPDAELERQRRGAG
jgi:tRNA threonylcarbamoyl adenosine modification protein YeaZ